MQGPRHHDTSRWQEHAAFAQHVGEPGDGGERIAEGRRSRPRADDAAVAGHDHAEVARVHVIERYNRAAEGDGPIACQVGDGVADGESPEVLDGVREAEGETASMQMFAQLPLVKLKQNKQPS